MATSRKLTSTNFSNLQQIQSTCPMQYAMQRLGGRWKMIIVWYVHVGVNRFSSLRTHIPTITTKMLTQQLRELERDALLERIVQTERPIHVTYHLTPAAQALIPILTALNTWALSEQALVTNPCGIMSGPTPWGDQSASDVV